LVSDERAANGGVMAGVKKAKTDNLTIAATIAVFLGIHSIAQSIFPLP